MLILLSPSKTLDMDQPYPAVPTTKPQFQNEAAEINKHLRQLKAAELEKLQSISDKLASLNYDRNQNFAPELTEDARPALFTFKGDVYDNMDVTDYSAGDLKFAQEHVGILSGLYGLLKPLDLMQPYRLEMGTKFAVGSAKNLYDFWGDKLTDTVNKQADGVVVNLASQEYFKAINKKKLKGQLIDVELKQNKDGKVRTIGLMAKRARGMMTDWVIKNQITDPADLVKFDQGGYVYQKEDSTETKLVFIKQM